MMLPLASLVNHQLGDVLGKEEGAGQDDGGLLRPLGQRHVEHAFLVEDDGTVDQDINATERLSRLRHRRLHLGFVGHVTHDTKRLTTALLDVIGTPVGILRLDIDTDNPGTSLRHAHSNAAADIGTGASDEGNFTLELHGRSRSRGASHLP